MAVADLETIGLCAKQRLVNLRGKFKLAVTTHLRGELPGTIGDHRQSAKLKYLAKARLCQILPGGGSERNSLF